MYSNKSDGHLSSKRDCRCHYRMPCKTAETSDGQSRKEEKLLKTDAVCMRVKKWYALNTRRKKKVEIYCSNEYAKKTKFRHYTKSQKY